jgi:hypothetical protein
MDRAGKQIGTVGDPATYSAPRLSPDGKRLAVAVGDPARAPTDIWIYDLVGGDKTRLTFARTVSRSCTTRLRTERAGLPTNRELSRCLHGYPLMSRRNGRTLAAVGAPVRAKKRKVEMKRLIGFVALAVALGTVPVVHAQKETRSRTNATVLATMPAAGRSNQEASQVTRREKKTLLGPSRRF